MARTFRKLPHIYYFHPFLPNRTKAVEHSLASAHRDRRCTYLRSIPHDWVNTFATRRLRRHDAKEIRRCIALDTWDDHVPGVYRRKNYPYYW